MNPQATTNPAVFQLIADGKELILPNLGMETLHHVHASDVAQMFVDVINHRNASLGESFHAVAKESMTIYGYARVLYQYFGKEPNISFLPWDKWCEYIDNEDYVDHAYHHLARSGHFSIENAEKLINYSPQYTTQETVEIAMASYIARGEIKVNS